MAIDSVEFQYIHYAIFKSMPGAAHFFFSIIIGLSLVVLTNKRFSAMHAFIFVYNNMLGPDLGWVMQPDEFAIFFHSPFGYLFMGAIIAAVITLVVRALDFDIHYAEVYSLSIAGALSHFLIDGLGHSMDGLRIIPFEHFSFNPEPFALLLTLMCIVIMIGSMYAVYASKQPRYEEKSFILCQVGQTGLTFSVTLGALLLLALMPFGSLKQFYLPDAIFITMQSTISNFWIVMISLGWGLIILFTSIYAKRSKMENQKRDNLIVGQLAFFAVFLFIVHWIWPWLGAGEGDLGVMYFVLVYFLVPAYLLIKATPKATEMIIPTQLQNSLMITQN